MWIYEKRLQYPINIAMKLALEMVLNHFHYTDHFNSLENKEAS